MTPSPREIVSEIRRAGGLAYVGSDEAVEAARQLLYTRRDRAVSDLELVGEQQLVDPNQTLQGIERALLDEEEKVERLRRDRQHVVEQARLWRQVGIQQRVRAPSLPSPVRWCVLAFLASIDFYVFALAMAKDADVAANPLKPMFLFGGLLGFVVFICGFFLAHQVKDWLYSRQQRRFMDEITQGERTVDDRLRVRLVTSDPPRLQLAITAAMFALLTGYAGAIRFWEMSAGDNPNVVIFLSLIPLLAACVELYLYDPSMVEPPGPTRRARQLVRDRQRWEGERGRIEASTAQAIGQVRAVYAEAEALLMIEIARIKSDLDARDADIDDIVGGDRAADDPTVVQAWPPRGDRPRSVEPPWGDPPSAAR